MAITNPTPIQPGRHLSSLDYRGIVETGKRNKVVAGDGVLVSQTAEGAVIRTMPSPPAGRNGRTFSFNHPYKVRWMKDIYGSSHGEFVIYVPSGSATMMVQGGQKEVSLYNVTMRDVAELAKIGKDGSESVGADWYVLKCGSDNISCASLMGDEIGSGSTVTKELYCCIDWDGEFTFHIGENVAMYGDGCHVPLSSGYSADDGESSILYSFKVAELSLSVEEDTETGGKEWSGSVTQFQTSALTFDKSLLHPFKIGYSRKQNCYMCLVMNELNAIVYGANGDPPNPGGDVAAGTPFRNARKLVDDVGSPILSGDVFLTMFSYDGKIGYDKHKVVRPNTTSEYLEHTGCFFGTEELNLSGEDQLGQASSSEYSTEKPISHWEMLSVRIGTITEDEGRINQESHSQVFFVFLQKQTDNRVGVEDDEDMPKMYPYKTWWVPDADPTSTQDAPRGALVIYLPHGSAHVMCQSSSNACLVSREARLNLPLAKHYPTGEEVGEFIYLLKVGSDNQELNEVWNKSVVASAYQNNIDGNGGGGILQSQGIEEEEEVQALSASPVIALSSSNGNNPKSRSKLSRNQTPSGHGDKYWGKLEYGIDKHFRSSVPRTTGILTAAGGLTLELKEQGRGYHKHNLKLEKEKTEEEKLQDLKWEEEGLGKRWYVAERKKRELEKKQKELEREKRKLENLEKQENSLRKIKQQRVQAGQSTKDLDEEIAKVNKEVSSEQKEVINTTQEVGDLEAQIETEEAAIEQKKQSVNIKKQELATAQANTASISRSIDDTDTEILFAAIDWDGYLTFHINATNGIADGCHLPKGNGETDAYAATVLYWFPVAILTAGVVRTHSSDGKYVQWYEITSTQLQVGSYNSDKSNIHPLKIGYSAEQAEYQMLIIGKQRNNIVTRFTGKQDSLPASQGSYLFPHCVALKDKDGNKITSGEVFVRIFTENGAMSTKASDKPNVRFEPKSLEEVSVTEPQKWDFNSEGGNSPAPVSLPMMGDGNTSNEESEGYDGVLRTKVAQISPVRVVQTGPGAAPARDDSRVYQIVHSTIEFWSGLGGGGTSHLHFFMVKQGDGGSLSIYVPSKSDLDDIVRLNGIPIDSYYIREGNTTTEITNGGVGWRSTTWSIDKGAVKMRLVAMSDSNDIKYGAVLYQNESDSSASMDTEDYGSLSSVLSGYLYPLPSHGHGVRGKARYKPFVIAEPRDDYESSSASSSTNDFSRLYQVDDEEFRVETEPTPSLYDFKAMYSPSDSSWYWCFFLGDNVSTEMFITGKMMVDVGSYGAVFQDDLVPTGSGGSATTIPVKSAMGLNGWVKTSISANVQSGESIYAVPYFQASTDNSVVARIAVSTSMASVPSLADSPSFQWKMLASHKATEVTDAVGDYIRGSAVRSDFAQLADADVDKNITPSGRKKFFSMKAFTHSGVTSNNHSSGYNGIQLYNFDEGGNDVLKLNTIKSKSTQKGTKCYVTAHLGLDKKDDKKRTLLVRVEDDDKAELRYASLDMSLVLSMSIGMISIVSGDERVMSLDIPEVEDGEEQLFDEGLVVYDSEKGMFIRRKANKIKVKGIPKYEGDESESGATGSGYGSVHIENKDETGKLREVGLHNWKSPTGEKLVLPIKVGVYPESPKNLEMPNRLLYRDENGELKYTDGIMLSYPTISCPIDITVGDNDESNPPEEKGHSIQVRSVTKLSDGRTTKRHLELYNWRTPTGDSLVLSIDIPTGKDAQPAEYHINRRYLYKQGTELMYQSDMTIIINPVDVGSGGGGGGGGGGGDVYWASLLPILSTMLSMLSNFWVKGAGADENYGSTIGDSSRSPVIDLDEKMLLGNWGVEDVLFFGSHGDALGERDVREIVSMLDYIASHGRPSGIEDTILFCQGIWDAVNGYESSGT